MIWGAAASIAKPLMCLGGGKLGRHGGKLRNPLVSLGLGTGGGIHPIPLGRWRTLEGAPDSNN